MTKRKHLNAAPVLAEPNCGVVPVATLKQGGEARDSTIDLPKQGVEVSDSRGGVQTSNNVYDPGFCSLMDVYFLSSHKDNAPSGERHRSLPCWSTQY